MELKGLYTALITPFDRNYLLDLGSLEALIEFQIENQVDGIVILGTTGEAPTLTLQEKETLIKASQQIIRGRTPLIVGTGSNSTQQTIENSLLAKEYGADAVLIVAPYYNKPTQEGIFCHFASICEMVDLPICIYNIQGRTGINIQTETIERIAEFTQIIGVKESSGNISQVSDVIGSISRKYSHFAVLAGDDALTLPIISLGGKGVISVASNALPAQMKTLVSHCLKGNFAEAQGIHFSLSPFFKSIFIETNPIPIKAVLNSMGMQAGPCRLPLTPIMPAHKKAIEEMLSAYFVYDNI